MADDFGTLFNSGTLEILTSADALLCTFTLSATAFAPATGGKIVGDVPKQVQASGAGTAAKATLKSTGAGTYELSELTVGTTATDVIIDNTSIAEDQYVNLTKLDWTESAGIA